MQYYGVFEDHGRKNAKGYGLRVEFAKSFGFGRIDEERTMSGREQFDFAVIFFADDGNKGSEAIGSKIVFEGFVDALESAGKIFVGAEASSGISAAFGSKHGGANTVSGDIGEHNGETAVGHVLPVEIIATGFVGGTIPTGNLESIHGGADVGKQRLLNGAGNAQIVLDACEAVTGLDFAQGGLDVFADFTADGAGDD